MADMPSVEEPEAEDSEVDLFITQAEVTEVVQQLLGGKAPGVDEIRPEYLKSLDVVGLSWLTRLCNIAWQSGTVPLDWVTGVVIPLFKKGDQRVCSNYRGITLLSLPGKVYSRVLERRVRPVLEGSWEFAQPVHMCFVDLEKAFNRVPRGILWEVLWEYGVGGEVLPQVQEFKYLGVLFTSEGRIDREIDRWISAAAAVMQSMYRSVVVKKELSRKAKLSIYQSIYVPTLTYGHELWVMTERVRSRIQAAEMSFLRRVAGRSLRDRVRSSVTRQELGVEPLLLHIKRGQLRWLGHLFRMPPGRLPGEVFRACPTGKRPRGRPRTRWRDYVSWLARECLGVPPEELEEVSGEREKYLLEYLKKKRSEIEIDKKTKWCKWKKEECCAEFRMLPDDWETTAEVIRVTGRKVLGVSSGRRKEDKETWWWNEEVQDSIQRKRLAKKKWDMDRTEENRQKYKESQRRVKREVSKAKQKAYDELYTRLDTREGEKDLYRLARQRDRDGKDVQQVRVIKDRDGRVLTSEESVQRRWKEYFEELMNEENEREKKSKRGELCATESR
ncbi:hypothetical protein QTP86_030660 [Hemibagrus guttatus]|nr:hypothetical protein QTP86_030660 [Hemibagrus guttatus]